MKPSALCLERYYFEELSFRHLEDFEPSTEAGTRAINDPIPSPALQCQVEGAEKVDDQRQCFCRVSVELPPDAAKFPYTFKATAIGIFRVSEQVPDSGVREFVDANAPALLFGAIREAVSAMTGRGPLPPATLNAVYFVPSPRIDSGQKSTPPLDADRLVIAEDEGFSLPAPVKKTARARRPKKPSS